MDNTERPFHKMRVLLFINPNSRSGFLQRQQILEELLGMGHEVLNQDNHKNTRDPNEIILKYRDSAQVVIVGGGDGSVNLILPALKETKLPLLVIPLGTANNLARHFSLPDNFKEALSLLMSGQVVDLDLGEVNRILFVNVAGLGLSTEVNMRVSKKLKKHLGVFAFILTAFQLIFKMNPFRALITTDGNVSLPTKSWQISICNGKHYGAGMTIKHNATLEDGKLHCLSTEVNKWWKGLLLIKSFMTGRYKKEQDITLVSGKEIKIETSRKFYIDVDGDIKTSTPAVFRVIPKSLKLIIPEWT